MSLLTADMQSVGTFGWWFTDTSGSTPDTTPPGLPTIVYKSKTSTSITVTHTPPADLDYSITEFQAASLDGGAAAEASSAVAGDVTISGSGLTPGSLYVVTATAKDATGNRSKPVVLAQLIRAEASSGLDYPASLYWYLDRRSTPSTHAPKEFDATVPVTSGKMEIVRKALHAGAVRNLRLRITCMAPVSHFEISELALILQTPEARPLGRGIE